MNKNIVEKIACLFAMILFMGAIGTGVGFAAFPFSDTRAAETPAQFVVVVNGTSIDFDWTAMSAADSYTMAVALQDVSGNVDLGTLQLLDMGAQKTFSIAGLPTGVIFHVTILAYSAQGLVVSNTVTFMPFFGNVIFPDSGDVIMQVADLGGIGNFTVSGSFDGDTANLTRISGDNGSGPFTLTVVNDKPVVYTKGDYILNFTYDAAGTIGILRTVKRTASSDMNDCQKIIIDKMDKLRDGYWDDIRYLRALHHDLICMVYPLAANYSPDDPRFNLDVRKKTSAKGKVWFIIDLIKAAAEGRNMTYQEELVKLKKQYDECKDDPTPTPDPVPGPVPLINIDNSCPHPDEAKHWVFEYETGQDEGWSISGIGQVGKKLSFVSEESYGTLHLQREICYASGEKNGWEITYQDDGNMLLASHYVNGVLDGHSYDFYEDGSGSLYIDNTFVNGVNTYRLVYYEDGSLKMWWDRDENIWHWTD